MTDLPDAAVDRGGSTGPLAILLALAAVTSIGFLTFRALEARRTR